MEIQIFFHFIRNSQIFNGGLFILAASLPFPFRFRLKIQKKFLRQVAADLIIEIPANVRIESMRKENERVLTRVPQKTPMDTKRNFKIF